MTNISTDINSLNMVKFTRANTLKGKVPNASGIYKFFDKNREIIYVGHAKHLRHRVQSYREVDDPKAHPTKTNLRREIRYYDYQVMPESTARSVEKRLKHKKEYKYNFL